MSRSYKKTPICKDHTTGMKKIANRKVRRMMKNPHVHLPGRLYRRAFNSYDICDWVFMGTDFETYYKEEVAKWKEMKDKYSWYKEEMPTRESCKKEWMKMYKNK